MLSTLFGILILFLQVVSTALVAENFEGAERDRVQGNLQAGQPGDGVSPSLHGGNPEPLPAASVQVVPQADEFLL